MPVPTFKVKVCLVGEPAVGKTSLIRRFVLDQFDDRYTTTLGAKTTKAEVQVADPRGSGTVGVSMLIWDIMGQREMPERLLRTYFHGTQGVIVVCDILRPETIERMRGWVQSVYAVVGPVPTFCAANKADLLREPGTPYNDTNLATQLSSLRVPYVLTSAKTGENVREVFSFLTQEILRGAIAEAPTTEEA